MFLKMNIAKKYTVKIYKSLEMINVAKIAERTMN